MNVGYVGPSTTMNERQVETFKRVMRRLAPKQFAHPDLDGSADQAATLMSYIDPRTVIVAHPPTGNGWRAWNQSTHEEREPLPPFAQARSLVDESEVVVFVRTDEDRPFPAWYAIDYARGLSRKVVIIDGDGLVIESGPIGVLERARP